MKLLFNCWQHPLMGQFSQLAIRQIQRIASAPNFPESLNKLRSRFIVPLPLVSQIRDPHLP